MNTLKGQTAPARLLRVPEVAEILGLSSKTVWNYVYARSIDSIVIGRSRRISLDAVQKLIDAGSVAAREVA